MLFLYIATEFSRRGKMCCNSWSNYNLPASPLCLYLVIKQLNFDEKWKVISVRRNGTAITQIFSNCVKLNVAFYQNLVSIALISNLLETLEIYPQQKTHKSLKRLCL